MRNLHKVRADQGVNAPGTPEIPMVVFEELLVNALAHRDYLISAPVRLFIFDNRVEIISPGHLPNNLTVEKIRTGNSNIRNPILVSYIAKGLLPYRGLGSGIKRAMENWHDIDFTDDRDGGLFTATIHRRALTSFTRSEVGAGNGSEKSSEKSSEKILMLLKADGRLSAREIAGRMGITQRAVEKQIAKLRAEGRIRRIGPAKGGRWVVVQ